MRSHNSRQDERTTVISHAVVTRDLLQSALPSYGGGGLKLIPEWSSFSKSRYIGIYILLCNLKKMRRDPFQRRSAHGTLRLLLVR